MQRSNGHFFASLKHLEKRLKLEDQPSVPTECCGSTGNTEQTESLGTPMHLNFNDSITNTNLDTSDAPPREFLSNSPDFSSTPNTSPQLQEAVDDATTRINVDDEIEVLMRLLRVNGKMDVGCDDGFYRKIVGVKGPKNLQEVERLEGWIKHFHMDENNKDPLRLAHLLLGRAAAVSQSGNLVFPSTLDHFLENDSPSHITTSQF